LKSHSFYLYFFSQISKDSYFKWNSEKIDSNKSEIDSILDEIKRNNITLEERKWG